jgi:hypothetical protein
LTKFDIDSIYDLGLRRYENRKNTGDTLHKIIRVLKLDPDRLVNMIVESKIVKHNTVMKSKTHLNSIYDINKSMAYQDTVPEKEVRDLLTQEELVEIQKLKGFPLICIWKKDKAQTDSSGFSGYFPVNSPIDADRLIPHRKEDHTLDILKDFCSGG